MWLMSGHCVSGWLLYFWMFWWMFDYDVCGCAEGCLVSVYVDVLRDGWLLCLWICWGIFDYCVCWCVEWCYLTVSMDEGSIVSRSICGWADQGNSLKLWQRSTLWVTDFIDGLNCIRSLCLWMSCMHSGTESLHAVEEYDLLLFAVLSDSTCVCLICKWFQQSYVWLLR